MNPIRALLWKEGREAAYKIAAGAGLALVAGLVCPQEELPHALNIEMTSHLVGILGAVLMGVGVVADERSRGTLPFLVSRPLGPGRLLGVKFAVGAAGLLVVLAAYWAGVFAVSEWVNFNAWGGWEEEIVADVGYIRMLLLWFSLYVMLYAAVFLASAFTDHSLKAAMIGLMVAWVGLFFLGVAWMLAPHMARFYFGLVFYTVIDANAGILRQAFDPSLFLTRGAAAALLVGGAILWARRGLRVQTSRRFQWIAGVLAAICGVILIGLNATEFRYRHDPVDPVDPVGQLPYKVPVVDLALKDELAVVLLERGVSVVDVADPRAPAEIGRWKIGGLQLKRLALSGSTAYAYGEDWSGSFVGVAVFDLSQPEHPRLQAQSLLYPIEKGPTPWLRRIPRLVGWAVWKGHLYAGLLGREFLELHSFDVREGGLPQPVHVLPLEKTTRHVWNYDSEIRVAGPHVFLTLGQDLVVLDLTDPGRPEELSRTPLRRFGRATRYEELVEDFHHQLSTGALRDSLVQYEELVEDFHHQLSTGALPDSLVQKLKQASRWLRLDMQETGGERIYQVDLPPGLGSVTLGGDRAYIRRYLPRELAVVDISDLRRPVEVDYIPRRLFRHGLTMDEDFAYAHLNRKRIGVYALTGYGTFSRRKILGLADRDKEEVDGWRTLNDMLLRYRSPKSYRVQNNIIPAGDHIYAVLKDNLNDNLVIFQAPRATE